MEFDRHVHRIQSQLRADLGSDFIALFDNPLTSELMLNPNGQLWVEQFGEPMRAFGTMAAHDAQRVIHTIAGAIPTSITAAEPILECEFPLEEGSRFTAQIPPIVCAPAFTLRKKASRVFPLDEYVERGIMSDQQRQALLEAIQGHRNILIVGGTASGKTTLLNAVIRAMVENHPSSRLFVIEDRREVQCEAVNAILYRTSGNISIDRILKTTLSMRPDRILVGEVRGPEALTLLMIWNTGHPGGAATIHADDVNSALTRLLMLVSMHPSCPRRIEDVIGLAAPFIVHIARGSDHKRRVQGMLTVDRFDGNKYVTRRIA